MSPSPVDYNDVQGLVRFGYNKLTESCFLLLNIRDVAAARAWLATAPVTNAVKTDQAPPTAVQIAFTREGLQALKVPDDVLAGFSAEFLSGMAAEDSRSRRLGDVGASAPEHWQWGGQGSVPHVVLMLYAQDGKLESWKQAIQGANWNASFDVITCLATSNLDGIEPFGFVDGISQPAIDWERQRTPAKDELAYGNLASLGEFLLGYPNEYGKYTDRPLLAPDSPASATLPAAEDVPDLRDLGRNGTYVVLRQLQQDVRGFWRFLDAQTHSDPQTRQGLGEAMVGRRMGGEPLAALTDDPIAGIDPATTPHNQFSYDSDAEGMSCPFGAHIRRANPRNADLPPGSAGWFSKLLHTFGFGNKNYRDDIIASTRFHRILRRGREYGPGLSPEQAAQPDYPDTGEHGIYFICLNANISRQFEFVQNAWIMSTKFNAMTEESDPLLGNRQPVAGCPVTDTFSIPQLSGLRTRITGVPQFITVRGGAYFFLPSLSALCYLASLSA
jgi:Dyp-type peroxidase family